LKREELIIKIADEISAIKKTRPTLVTVDGIDASGKTILASELSMELRNRGKNVIESSIDFFHNPLEVRYQRGRDNPEGYYLDSFNLDALRKNLLDPLKNGNLQYSARFFDYLTNTYSTSPILVAELNSILVFDRVFSLRKQLRSYWDYSIYIYISEDESLRRGIERDSGNREEAKRRYLERYIQGQRLYHLECCPIDYADIIVDNNDPVNPEIQ
jgi:uridine kinase